MPMTPRLRRLVLTLILSSLSFLCPQFPTTFAQEEPSLEEISKTEAAKLFVQKRYRESAAEFETLEDQHPQSGVIKRYLGSLYNTLGEWDKAAGKLKEALTLKEDDEIARQLLADIYVKQTKFDDAAHEFQIIQKQDPEGPSGRYATTRLREIEILKAAPQSWAGERMSVMEFMQSQPARDFAGGRFEEAVSGFDSLLARYPKDILIRRFRGIALTRLGRHEEALAAFQEVLQIEPQNAAVHFYLGEAHLAANQPEEARKEFQWVIAHDEASYKIRAQHAIFWTLGHRRRLKPWSFRAAAGYDFDTNATFRSNDPTVATAADQNAHRFHQSVQGTYRFRPRGPWTFTADGLYTQMLYDRFKNLQTYTADVGISALYVFSLKEKPAALNFREGVTYTILKNKFFVATNTLSTSFIVNLHQKWRATVSHRFLLNEFDNDGSNPTHTSRDGMGNISSLLNTVYLNDAGNFYMDFGYDFERHDTDGEDFIRNTHAGRLGLHFPVIEKVEGDITYRFRDANYNQFATIPPKRRDDVHTLNTSLSRLLTDTLKLTLSYLYEDSRSKNNQYEYSRHVFGAQLAYTY